MNVRRRSQSSAGPLIAVGLFVLAAAALAGTWWFLGGDEEVAEAPLWSDTAENPFDEVDIDDGFVMIVEAGEEWEHQDERDALIARMQALRIYIDDELLQVYPEAKGQELRVRLRSEARPGRFTLRRIYGWAAEFEHFELAIPVPDVDRGEPFVFRVLPEWDGQLSILGDALARHPTTRQDVLVLEFEKEPISMEVWAAFILGGWPAEEGPRETDIYVRAPGDLGDLIDEMRQRGVNVAAMDLPR